MSLDLNYAKDVDKQNGRVVSLGEIIKIDRIRIFLLGSYYTAGDGYDKIYSIWLFKSID